MFGWSFILIVMSTVLTLLSLLVPHFSRNFLRRSTLILNGFGIKIGHSDIQGFTADVPAPPPVPLTSSAVSDKKKSRNKKVRITFIRHAQSIGNAIGESESLLDFFFNLGRAILCEVDALLSLWPHDSAYFDWPLSPKGVKQAEELAKHLENDAVSGFPHHYKKSQQQEDKHVVIVTSNLKRTMQTTKIVLNPAKHGASAAVVDSAIQEVAHHIDADSPDAHRPNQNGPIAKLIDGWTVVDLDHHHHHHQDGGGRGGGGGGGIDTSFNEDGNTYNVEWHRSRLVSSSSSKQQQLKKHQQQQQHHHLLYSSNCLWARFDAFLNNAFSNRYLEHVMSKNDNKKKMKEKENDKSHDHHEIIIVGHGAWLRHFLRRYTRPIPDSDEALKKRWADKRGRHGVVRNLSNCGCVTFEVEVDEETSLPFIDPATLVVRYGDYV